MSVSKPDILQIRKYLNGELTAREMYELELRAQNDPYLMDAIMGIEAATGDHQPHLNEIDRLLKQRVEKDENRVIPIFKAKYWVAASILFTLGIGGWWLLRQSPDTAIENNMVNLMKPEKPKRTDSMVVIATSKSKPTPSMLNPVMTAPLKNDKKLNRLLPVRASAIADSATLANDVVVRGYIKRDRDQTTGSSYIITGKEVQDNPVGNVEQLLQGKVAGLNIRNNAERQQVVTGVVTDVNTGEPIAGATISTKATGALGQTDVNGKFKIKLPASIDSLMATYISYKQTAIALQRNNNVSVAMVPESHSLNEVAIRGYVKRNRDQTTGSSYIITGNEVSDACKENKGFKRRFFKKIGFVEKYMLAKDAGEKQTISDGKFFRSLKFIAKRTKVTADIKGETGYDNLESYKQDKIAWLAWYEANKCHNLK